MCNNRIAAIATLKDGVDYDSWHKYMLGIEATKGEDDYMCNLIMVLKTTISYNAR